MRLSRSLLAVSLLALAAPAVAAEPARPEKAAPPSASAPAEKCEHGVQKVLCTRCNPKLAPIFKAKGDWCPEHERPETQCVLCHPELAKKGVK